MQSESTSKVDTLFYTSNFRALSTTHIGYVYELAQAGKLVLATEPLDSHVESHLRDRDFFPGLLEIVIVNQYSCDEGLLAKNRRLAVLANSLLTRYSPSLVVATSDNDSLFELYLLREARERNAHRVTISATINVGERPEIAKWVSLYRQSALSQKMGTFLAKYLAELKGLLGHILIYWVLPILNLKLPFLGPASYVLMRGHTGMRDSELHVTLSEKERGIYLRSGVPEEKLAVLPHPVSRSSRTAFEKVHLSRAIGKSTRMAVVLLPAESTGYTQGYRELPHEQYVAARKGALRAIAAALPGWDLVLKPHPSLSDMGRLQAVYGEAVEAFRVVPPNALAEPYLMCADIVIDLPRAASTALFFTRLSNPGCALLALDFFSEYLGDYYKGEAGIHYITSLDELAHTLTRLHCADSATPNSCIAPDASRTLPDLLREKGLLPT